MTKHETNRHKAIHKKDTRKIKKNVRFAHMFNLFTHVVHFKGV